MPRNNNYQTSSEIFGEIDLGWVKSQATYPIISYLYITQQI